MNVLFDISILGACHAGKMRRTGIPRAVEELARQLQTLDECRLTFCGTEGSEASERFLRETDRLRSASFAPVRLERLVNSVSAKVSASLNAAYAANGPDGSRGTLRDRARVAVWHRLHQHLPEADLDPRAVRDAEIFHTPHSPIIEPLRRFRHLTFFQTIYDMIPFILPNTYTSDILDYYHRLLARLRPTDWILTDSLSAKHDFCTYTKFDPERVFVTYLAADPAKFHPEPGEAAQTAVRRKYAIPDGPYVLSICTFEPRKNLAHVIRSFAKLVQQEPSARDLTLVLAGGSGWKDEGIRAEMENIADLRKRIVVTGFVDDADLAPLYAGALAFLYLSLYEGFGLPALEAMQCGAPVVASNTSSLPEVVADAGVLLDPHDEEALCQTILNLYRDDVRRAELSQRALARAQEFCWERCARETVAAYGTALAAR